MNKRTCDPGDNVRVVLCVSPIVSASCESGSESSSWPPHQLWQDVPPNEESRRACVCVSSRPSGVSSSLSESECACVLYPPTSTSACLSDLLQPFCVSLWLLRASSIPGSTQHEASSSPHVHAHMIICIVCLFEHKHQSVSHMI